MVVQRGGGVWCAVFAWHLCAMYGAASATLDRKRRSSTGSRLLLRQTDVPVLAPVGVSEAATSHIFMNIQKLKQEAVNAVAQESSLITSVALNKEQEARDLIEREIPLAGQNDTQMIAKDLEIQQKDIDATMKRSTDEAKEALQVLQNHTENAINVSTLYVVDKVAREAEESVVFIANHSTELQAEAEALAREAKGAANFSQQAANNSELWVKELPVEEAAEAVATARKAEQESIQVRHEYEDTKRMAKLAGNLALDTLRIAAEAERTVEKTKQEATETAEQAAQNALLLNTIRAEAKKASQVSMNVLAR